MGNLKGSNAAYVGNNDMCRTSSAMATPDTSCHALCCATCKIPIQDALQSSDMCNGMHRWADLDAGNDDMCRTSSAVATPETSYATGRAGPVSLSQHSVSSGHSSRKGHLAAVQTTSPIIARHRYVEMSYSYTARSSNDKNMCCGC